MSGLFRRPSNLNCYFCQSPCHSARDPRNFRCPSCSCWNRYDEKGIILSDEPAMHDESLNSRAFAKRGMWLLRWVSKANPLTNILASPSKSQLPTMYGQGPFCHTCQTNQMLLVNLLSNYLPHPSVRALKILLSRHALTLLRIQNISIDLKSSPNTGNHFMYATHQCVNHVFLLLKMKFEERTPWRGLKHWEGG